MRKSGGRGRRRKGRGADRKRGGKRIKERKSVGEGGRVGGEMRTREKGKESRRKEGRI